MDQPPQARHTSALIPWFDVPLGAGDGYSWLWPSWLVFCLGNLSPGIILLKPPENKHG